MANANNKNSTRVVQVSDSHLFEDLEGTLLGLNTQSTFELVLDMVRAEQKGIDLFLCTGDLSQDGSAVAYQRFHDAISEFNRPAYWLPGNHDNVPVMKSTLNDDSKISPCVIDLDSWQIIMLDSAITGKVPGRLEKDQLDFLDKSLAASTGKNVMVCLHHHPVPMESRWLDGVALLNPEDLFEITDRYDHIKAMVWGHVHQLYEGIRNGVRMFALPSTCAQFKPKSEDFTADSLSPGYRWFDLYEDGTLDTGVSRVEGVEFKIDYSVKGY